MTQPLCNWTKFKVKFFLRLDAADSVRRQCNLNAVLSVLGFLGVPRRASLRPAALRCWQCWQRGDQAPRRHHRQPVSVRRLGHWRYRRQAMGSHQQSGECIFLHMLHIIFMLTYFAIFFAYFVHRNAYECIGEILMGSLHIFAYFCIFLHIRAKVASSGQKFPPQSTSSGQKWSCRNVYALMH